MTTSTCDVPTTSASRYLQQLCKHFAHKVPAEGDAAHGRISFPKGPVELTAAPDRLVIAVTAEDETAIAELEDVVARHLVRFAFRETLAFDWRGESTPAA